jgi:hypothetical protein
MEPFSHLAAWQAAKWLKSNRRVPVVSFFCAALTSVFALHF